MYDVPMKILPEGDLGLRAALGIIHAGGVVAHATETCYGFACDLGNPKAVEKLFRIKQRPFDQPVSALFASVDEAKKFAVWNARAEELAQKFLPGPLTLILPLHPDAPSKLIPSPSPSPNPSPTVGVRISSHLLATSLVKKYKSPLSTTSANIHGKPNPYSAEDIRSQFRGAEFQPDLIIDSGTLPQVPPSTIINCMSEKGDTMRKGTV